MTKPSPDAPPRFWTDERIEELKAFVMQGQSSRQIAKTMGCTRNSIVGKANRLGFHHLKKAEAAAKIPPKRSHHGPKSPPIDSPPMEPSAPLPINLLDQFSGEGKITIWKLKSHHCRWPYGDHPPFLFCGEAVEEIGMPYCAEHHAISRGPGSRSERRAV